MKNIIFGHSGQDPVTVVLNENGKVVAVHQGHQIPEDLLVGREPFGLRANIEIRFGYAIPNDDEGIPGRIPVTTVIEAGTNNVLWTNQTHFVPDFVVERFRFKAPFGEGVAEAPVERQCPHCGGPLFEVPDLFDPRDGICAICGELVYDGS